MESSFKILLVDDQQIVLDGLKKQLNWSRFNGLICGFGWSRGHKLSADLPS